MADLKNFSQSGVGPDVQYGKAGDRIKFVTDHLEVRNAADTLFSQMYVNLNPDDDQAAASKFYVDAIATGLRVREAVPAASTANLSNWAAGQFTSQGNTLDGVTLANDFKILIKDQTNLEENGIYIVSSLGSGANGIWDRDPDYDTAVELDASFFFVEDGTANAASGWVINVVKAGFIINTSAINVLQFSQAGAYTAGGGLAISAGQEFSVDIFGESADTSVLDSDIILLENGAGGTLFKMTRADLVGSLTITMEASQRILASTGTEALPSISFQGDPDTGFASLSDTLAASVGGTTRFTLQDPTTTDAVAIFAGTSAVTLTAGLVSERPSSGVTGMLRYSTTNDQIAQIRSTIEWYDGTNWIQSGDINHTGKAKYVTVGAIATVTYANGTAGVGTTLTNNDGGFPALSIDGATPVVGNRILVKDQASGEHNGIYVLTQDDATNTQNFILTRAVDNDTADQVDATTVTIQEGATESGTAWIANPVGTVTMGTTAIPWSQFGGGGNAFGVITGDTGTATADEAADSVLFAGATNGGITTIATDNPEVVTFSVTPIDMATTGATIALGDFLIVSDSADSATSPAQKVTLTSLLGDLDIPNAIGVEGFVTRTASDTYTARTIIPSVTNSEEGITITNGDGVAGNPSIGLDITGQASVSVLAGTDQTLIFDGTNNVKIIASDLAAGLADLNNTIQTLFATVTFNGGATQTIGTLPSDGRVLRARVDVNTVWDVTETIDLGINGGANDAIMPDIDNDPELACIFEAGADYRNSTAGNQTVEATVSIGGGAAQGSALVVIEYMAGATA